MPICEQTGSITLHRASDEKIELVWFNDAGEELDISESAIRFVVEKGFSLVPGLDPDNPKGRLLHFTEEHANSLGNYTSRYAVIISDGDDDAVLWEGKIKAAGFSL